MPPLPRTASLPALPAPFASHAGAHLNPLLWLNESHREALRSWVASAPDTLELPARNEAVTRILDCARRQHHTLNLCGLGLSTLPPIVFEMDWLLGLRLDDNRLTRWPEGVSRLPRLRHVNLARNRLTELAAEFEALQGRCHFVLDGNPLGAAPSSPAVIPAHRQRPQTPQLRLMSGPITYAEALHQPGLRLHPPPPVQAPPPALNHVRDTILTLRSLATRDAWPQRELDAGINETTLALAEYLPRAIETWSLAAGGVGLLLPAPDRDTLTALINDDNAGSFAAWLMRLTETADHAFPGERVLQNTRVLEVLKQVQSDRHLRGVIFSIAREAIESCGDRIAIGLNQMEMAIVAARAERGDVSVDTLFELGRTQYRLERLNAIAQAHARRCGREDELVEVELAFQSGLRERLALPVGARRLLYAISAQVRQKDLDEAEADILAGETAPVDAALAHVAQLINPAHATAALLSPPPRHPLASAIAEHYRPWTRPGDSPIKAQMYRCLEELSERNAHGPLTTYEYLTACQEAMFFANHGEAYRRALEHLHALRAGPPLTPP